MQTWTMTGLTCPGSLLSQLGNAAGDVPEESLLGAIGRVTVSIPEHGPGEVLLPVRGGTEAFAAWSDEPIPRHTRVLVVECMSARSVLVTPFR
jgi:hypothetical protein